MDTLSRVPAAFRHFSALVIAPRCSASPCERLLSYGTSRTELFERLGGVVVKILQGARPGDVPVEEPTRYELIVSETTAKALGLTIPASVRSAAEMLP